MSIPADYLQRIHIPVRFGADWQPDADLARLLSLSAEERTAVQRILSEAWRDFRPVLREHTRVRVRAGRDQTIEIAPFPVVGTETFMLVHDRLIDRLGERRARHLLAPRTRYDLDQRFFGFGSEGLAISMTFDQERERWEIRFGDLDSRRRRRDLAREGDLHPMWQNLRDLTADLPVLAEDTASGEAAPEF